MRITQLIFAILLVISGCTDRKGSPPEFPFPMSLPSSVSVIGDVRHERDGQFEVGYKDSKQVVSGEMWTGHVRVEGFEKRDAYFLAVLERSLIEGTGWESIFRDENREIPIAILHRSLGGEHLWITLEGWPEDVTVTMVHRK
jgi:hypothetical protein